MTTHDELHFIHVDKPDDSGMFRGAFLSKVRAQFGARCSARRGAATCLYDRQLATGANHLPSSEMRIAQRLIDPRPPKYSAADQRDVMLDASVRERSTCQTAISFA